jgi:cell wall-associated NlpC family hydrolase
MTGLRTAALVLAPAPAFTLILVLLAGGGAQHAQANTHHVPGNSQLNEQAVPTWARQAIKDAANTCPEITAPLLAAQIEAESNWNPDAYNPHSQATGLAQFIPATWQAWGQDGDHDGNADPRSPADAIPSQAAYMCHLLQLVKDSPGLAGELIDLTLASYNAGPGQVRKHRGIPPFPETTDYITKIRRLANTKYSYTPPATGEAQAIIDKAAEHVGKTMYAWGGGTLNGPSPGTAIDAGIIGFDCSSLVRYAYYQGTNGRITLPRTSQEQYNATKSHPVPIPDLQPGDLLFFGKARIHHVALYIGNGRMIEAPQSGQRITEASIRTDGDFASATRPTKHNQP